MTPREVAAIVKSEIDRMHLDQSEEERNRILTEALADGELQAKYLRNLALQNLIIDPCRMVGRIFG